jgi:hypothetical protein
VKVNDPFLWCNISSAARKAVSYAEAAGSSDDSHLSQAGPQRHRSSGKGLDSGLKESDSDSTEGWSGSERTGSDTDTDSSGASSDLATEESADEGEESVASTKRHHRPQVSKTQQTDHGLMSGAGRCVWTPDMVSLN